MSLFCPHDLLRGGPCQRSESVPEVGLIDDVVPVKNATNRLLILSQTLTVQQRGDKWAPWRGRRERGSSPTRLRYLTIPMDSNRHHQDVFIVCDDGDRNDRARTWKPRQGSPHGVTVRRIGRCAACQNNRVCLAPKRRDSTSALLRRLSGDDRTWAARAFLCYEPISWWHTKA